MKKTILNIFLIFTMMLPSSVFATERTFPAGSYIIPMDSVYQPSADGGIFEAYGLVYQLLDNGVTIYWSIDENKTAMTDPDFIISDATATVANPVVWEYDHNNGTIPVSAAAISTSISYTGAPFIVDNNDPALTAAAITATLNDVSWSAVNIHKSRVPFTANIAREMVGTPPKIALMNNKEDKTTGNAAILQSYMRLAGICDTNYDIVSPLEIRDGILDSYDLLWAPHWTGYKDYPNDVEAIITAIRNFLDGGNGLFAECASIESFEHSVNGRFLSDNGFGHNGGTMDSTKMIYDYPAEVYNQVGDFAYSPEGGHLHNWKPYSIGDPYTSVGTPPTVNSSYNNTVKRFTYDDADGNLTTTDDQWDYYVGGRYNGDSSKGYVLYLGGHKYASCSIGSVESGSPGTHLVDFEFAKDFANKVKFEFKKDISDEVFTFVINYNSGSSLTLTPVSKSSHAVSAEDPNLKVDFTNAIFDKKKIKEVTFAKMGSTAVTIDSIVISWTGGDSGQKTKKIKVNGSEVSNNQSASPSICTTNSFTVEDSSEVFTFVVNYNSGSSLTITPVSGDSHAISAQNAGGLKVDFTNAVFDGKTISNVTFENLGTSSTITIDSIDISWTGGVNGQKIKKILDNDTKVFDHNGLASTANCTTSGFSIEGSGSGGSAASCSNNSDCTWKNVAGVRYVLNTLFNLQYSVVDVSFSKSTSIVHNDLLYKGEYKYPSFKGDFEIYDVESATPALQWSASEHIDIADNRTIYTALDTDGTVDGIIKTNPVLIDFTVANLPNNAIFQNALELGIPYSGNEVTYQDLLHKVRGKQKDNNGVFQEQYKVGGIMHSSSAIVGPFYRTPSRPTMAYVGTMYGTLHAFKVFADKQELDGAIAANTVNDYKELWAFVPYSQLGSLQHDRTDEPPVSPFPGIDASATVSEVYADFGNGKEWKTILVSMNGIFGKYSSVYALDITKPDPAVAGGGPKILWEVRGQDHPIDLTDNVAPTSIIMGSGYRTTISRLKVDVNGTMVEKYYVFTATNYIDAGGTQKGLYVFAFDLLTGDQKWVFSVPYKNQNDVPGALTAVDTDTDGYVDALFVGDMDGRIWMLNAADGANLFGTDDNVTIVTAGLSDNIIYRALNFLFRIPNAFAVSAVTNEIPLFNGGIYDTETATYTYAGIDYPISGSISVTKSVSGGIIAYFGTGGADWADLTGKTGDDSVNHIFAVEVPSDYDTASKSYKDGAGTVKWDYPLEPGEKVWGAVTIAGNNVYVGTSFGTVESADPNDDKCDPNTADCGRILSLNKETGADNWTPIDTNEKVRSSLFMKRGHLYATLNNGTVQQLGNGNFTVDKNVEPLTWRER